MANCFALSVVHIASGKYSQDDFIFSLQNMVTLVADIATFLKKVKSKSKFFDNSGENVFKYFRFELITTNKTELDFHYQKSKVQFFLTTLDNIFSDVLGLRACPLIEQK